MRTVIHSTPPPQAPNSAPALFASSLCTSHTPSFSSFPKMMLSLWTQQLRPIKHFVWHYSFPFLSPDKFPVLPLILPLAVFSTWPPWLLFLGTHVISLFEKWDLSRKLLDKSCLGSTKKFPAPLQIHQLSIWEQASDTCLGVGTSAQV